MKIDANDTRPPFRQAADDLRKRIEKKEFGPGQVLPSIKALAAEYGVAPQTMQNALRILREDGLVVSQQGRGLFVRDPKRPIAAGTDAERITAAEAAIAELREQVAALEADNAELRTIATELRRPGQKPRRKAGEPG